MKIRSAQLVSQIHFNTDIPDTDFKHIAFIGRSNVGKSSLINALSQTSLARSSSTPGRTKTINFYLLNKNLYFVDLPGYGFSQGSVEARKILQQLIEWYLTYPGLTLRQLIVLIIDAKVGVTDLDRQMLNLLMELQKNVVVAANKIDKLKKNDLKKRIEEIENEAHPYPVVAVSVHDKVGLAQLTQEIFSASL